MKMNGISSAFIRATKLRSKSNSHYSFSLQLIPLTNVTVTLFSYLQAKQEWKRSVFSFLLFRIVSSHKSHAKVSLAF